MKRIGVILLLAIALCLGGCQKDNRREDVNNWCMEDLKFYDYEGKPAWELTIDNRVISLSDKAGLQTYRGVKIGDDEMCIRDSSSLGSLVTPLKILSMVPLGIPDKWASSSLVNPSSFFFCTIISSPMTHPLFFLMRYLTFCFQQADCLIQSLPINKNITVDGLSQ